MSTKCSISFHKNGKTQGIVLGSDGYLTGQGFNFFSYMFSNKGRAFIVTFIESIKFIDRYIYSINLADNGRKYIDDNSGLSIYHDNVDDLRYYGDNNIYVYNLNSGIFTFKNRLQNQDDWLKFNIYSENMKTILKELLFLGENIYNPGRIRAWYNRLIENHDNNISFLFNGNDLNLNNIGFVLRINDKLLQRFEKLYKKNLNIIEKMSSKQFLRINNTNDIERYILNNIDHLKSVYNNIPDKLKYDYIKYYRKYDSVPSINEEFDNTIHSLHCLRKIVDIYDINDIKKDISDRSRNL